MNITGSSLPLLQKCQWWANEFVPTPPPFEPNEAMQLGTEVHAAIENFLLGKPPAPTENAKPLFEEWRQWWAQSPLSALSGWRAEQAFGYDVANDVARALSIKNRKYVVNPGEIAGTVDALHVNPETKHGIIVDWKTGMDFGKFTADAADNWQLKLYALCAARTFGLESAQVMIVRINDHGVSTTEYTMDALELDAVSSNVASLVAKVPTAQPKPGPHCKRCRAVAVCPTTEAATTAIAAPSPVNIEIKSAEQASAALARLRQVQAACEQVESILKAYAAENGGILVSPGKRYMRVTVERESINLTGSDGAAGIAAIEAAGAIDAVETKASTSKTALERTLKASGLKGKELRVKMDTLLSELRATGVVRATSVEAFREVEE